jgi:hypothetical protein
MGETDTTPGEIATQTTTAVSTKPSVQQPPLDASRRNRLLLDKKEQQYIDSRIQDIEKASTRSRWIYVFVLLASMMLFSVAYNEYFSWARGMAMKLPEEMNSGHWQDRLHFLLMREWVSSLQFDLPYVGGKFGASDAGTVGGMVLFIVGVWCLHSAKRENYLVYLLAKDVKDFDFSKAAKFYLATQVASTQLFVVSPKASRIYSPDDIERKALGQGEFSDGLDGVTVSRGVSRLHRFFVRISKTVVFFVFMAPAISLVFVFGVDMATLGERSPFRSHVAFEQSEHGLQAGDARDEMLYLQICKNKDSVVYLGNRFVFNFWRCESSGLKRRLAVSLLMMLAVLVVMFRAWQYQAGTEAMVLHAGEWKADLLREQSESRKESRIAGSNTSTDPPASSSG